jgi:hypothetical protein
VGAPPADSCPTLLCDSFNPAVKLQINAKTPGLKEAKNNMGSIFALRGSLHLCFSATPSSYRLPMKLTGRPPPETCVPLFCFFPCYTE